MIVEILYTKLNVPDIVVTIDNKTGTVYIRGKTEEIELNSEQANHLGKLLENNDFI